MPATATRRFADTGWLRTEPIRLKDAPDARVDRANNAIMGVIVAERGVMKDGRGQFTDESLTVIEKLARQPKLSRKGLKSRLSHPSLSEDGIGSFLGRVRDVQTADGVSRGTLFFDKAAFDSPKGNLADYVMTLAEDDPEAFGMSLVLQSDYLDPETLEPVEHWSVLEPGQAIWMPTALHAVDVVDEANATNSFLSVENLNDSAVRYGQQTLDKLFRDASRDDIQSRCTAWLDRYLNKRFGELPMTTPVDPSKSRDPSTPAAQSATTPNPSAAADALLPASPPSAGVDVAAVEKHAQQKAQERVTKIMDLCELAKVDGAKTREFIMNAQLSAEDVRDELFRDVCKRQSLAPEVPRGDTEPDPDAALKAEYLAQKPWLGNMTEEQFVKTRKISLNGGIIPNALATA